MILWRGTCDAPFVRRWGFVLLLSIFLISLLLNPTAKPSKQIHGWGWLVLALGLTAVYLLGVIFSRVQVEIQRDSETLAISVNVRFGSGWPTKRIPMDHVESVAAIDIRPMEWGGWGYRWVPWKRGSAAVLRAGDGLRFDLRNGKVFVVTVDGAQSALAFLNR